LTPGNYSLIHYNGEPLGNLNGKLSLLHRYHANTWATLFDDGPSTTVMLNIAQVPQWNVDANGSWATAGNWSPTVVPTGATGVAGFLGKITAPRTVTVGATRTIGAIIFDNANRYTLTSGSLVVGDAANAGTIEVANGSHVISTDLTFAGNTQINIAGGQALTLSSATTLINANQTVTKIGDGTLTIGGKLSLAPGSALNVDGGTVNLNANPGGGSAANSSLAVSINGSRVVLGTNADLKELSVNYAAPGSQTLDLSSPLSSAGFHAVRVYSPSLDAAKADLWNAIVNANGPGAPDPQDGIVDLHQYPNSRIGIGKMSDHVLVRSTRIGDLNLDGTVTIADFIDLASHFNTLGTATWQEGDLNYDRNVTIADFIDLASNFGSSYTGEIMPISAADAAILADFAEEHGASVPETGMCGLAMMSVGLIWQRRRREIAA
jgi:hypothetical protein